MVRLPLVVGAAFMALATVTASPVPIDAIIDQARAEGKTEAEILTHINAPPHPSPAFLPSLNGRDPSGDVPPARILNDMIHRKRTAEHASVARTVVRFIGDVITKGRLEGRPDVDAYEGMEELVTRPRWRFGWRG
ncbi:hypothetical protein P152DRAFT_517208 [Eremomyces bilateralis CBS 781.70]|uniref:Uncharacterized protein n=1 Tax=Eremomyces bilateralis CBS 781.70 TaxID=1392243 RepID=A0A6G1FSL4_9PEZI|nr:uncharacterized protein P152DRAFT_517208 [Eremomyces bilateralis CBS 781.70]KAF1808855.1 hypothetical protein P152DRAFT_517208 [Eremomyces bilateralis CBS 781.70]